MGLFDFFRKKDASNKQVLQQVESKVRVTSYSKNEDKITFSLAGTNFCSNDEIERILELEYAEDLKLTAEPENPYDKNAIRVETIDGCKIGYVPKDIISELRTGSGELKSMRSIFTKRSDHPKPFVTIYIEFL